MFVKRLSWQFFPRNQFSVCGWLIFTLCTSTRISFLLISGEKNKVASAAIAWGRLALLLGNLSNYFSVLCLSIHFSLYTAAIAKINSKYKANFCSVNPIQTGGAFRTPPSGKIVITPKPKEPDDVQIYWLFLKLI